jgi:prepilin-type N-terminal cleavage/methylation domain-containing protein
MIPTARRAQRGWSLVELAVALVIAAVLTMVVVTLLPLGVRVVDYDRQQRELAQAEQALLGHARVHARLPAADSDGDGDADAGATAGWLPVEDLGLPPRMRVRYQVQPDLAASPGNLFRPLLAPDYDTTTSNTANGLDLCMRLLLDQRAGTPLGGLGMPVGYYLAHSGTSGHAQAGDTGWNVAAQRLPGDAVVADVATAAAGPGEFASRLACTDRLARAEGSAQAALAAYSARRMADFYLQFRQFDIKIADLVHDQAESGLAFAGVDLAMAIADEAIAITLTAAGWPPDGLGIPIGIGEHVVALGSIGFAAYQVDAARKDLQSAQEGIAEAQQVLARATADRDRVQLLYTNANQTAVRLDQAGLDR